MFPDFAEKLFNSYLTFREMFDRLKEELFTEWFEQNISINDLLSSRSQCSMSVQN